jgi:hypothetical protein
MKSLNSEIFETSELFLLWNPELCTSNLQLLAEFYPQLFRVDFL